MKVPLVQLLSQQACDSVCPPGFRGDTITVLYCFAIGIFPTEDNSQQYHPDTGEHTRDGRHMQYTGPVRDVWILL